jgi:hypothetical protein
MNNKPFPFLPFLLILLSLIALFISGCDDQSPTTGNIVSVTNQVAKAEYTVTSKGTFRAGYDNEVREILIIKDNITGAEYLTITDCSMIRRVKEVKQKSREDLTDAASDVAESLTDAFSDFSD